jgi:UV DNA damage repair endonuclease
MNTKYGLISISKILKEENELNSFKGLSKKQFSELAREQGDDVAMNQLVEDLLHNLSLTARTIDFCRDSGIDHYRLNLSLFGLLSNPSFDIEFNDLPKQDLILEGIRDVGRTSITKGVSLSIQPDKFCKLIDDDELTVKSSIKELNFYSWFLDQLGAQDNISSPIFLQLSSQPEKDDHDSYCDFTDSFFESFKQLNKNTQNRLVLKNSDSGSWSAFNLFKYLHVYCFEEHDFGFPLAYNNLYDQVNPSSIEGSTIDAQVNIGAFHETWRGVVPVFTWSESSSSGSSRHAKKLSKPIPDFGYQIKWEIDVTDRDIAILEMLGPDDPSRMTADQLIALAQKKYRKVSDNYNALYEASRRSNIVSQSNDVKFNVDS